jgi:CRP-like cAMP-binding protein
MGGETGNRMMDALPAAARRLCHKALVDLPAGKLLARQGEPIIQAFFPTTAVCSVSVELASGNKAETATVGSDGFVGVPLVLGSTVSEASKTIQVAGCGYLVTAQELLGLCREHENFRRALFGYSAYRLHLASRSVACNSFHSIPQRLARWLLFAQDRAGGTELQLTHEALSAVLATTRPRVTQAAAKLKSAGIIAYQRGRVRILDRQRLRAVSCECYEETKNLRPAPGRDR